MINRVAGIQDMVKLGLGYIHLRYVNGFVDILRVALHQSMHLEFVLLFSLGFRQNWAWSTITLVITVNEVYSY